MSCNSLFSQNLKYWCKILYAPLSYQTRPMSPSEHKAQNQGDQESYLITLDTVKGILPPVGGPKWVKMAKTGFIAKMGSNICKLKF